MVSIRETGIDNEPKNDKNSEVIGPTAAQQHFVNCLDEAKVESDAASLWLQRIISVMVAPCIATALMQVLPMSMISFMFLSLLQRYGDIL